MKAWFSRLAWQVSVALGLIEPPRLQPIPIPAEARRPTRAPRR
ncbi:PA1414 family protein [Pseudomonas sp. RIT-PI-AD]|nr:PA1414 family protein [Pseudomonas sp. RIT-PI-AD]